MVITSSKMEVKASLQKLSKNIATENEYEYYSVVEKVKNGSSIMSYYFFVTLHTEGKRDLKLFVKIAGWTKQLREVVPVTCPFTVELYFYRTLREKYELLENINGVPEEYRFRMPKFYGSRDEYLYETLAMEDLVAEGYQDFDRQNAADLEYMSRGIALMAQFHALSLAYSQHDPEGFAKTSEILSINVAKVETWLKTVTPEVLSTAFEAAGTHRDKLESYFETQNFIEQIMEYYHPHNKNFLIHGDFKPSNLMHRWNEKLEIVVMDFQLVHDGDPVIDLLYFIFTATDEKFRRAHYEELLDMYYEKLRTSALMLHVDLEKVYSAKTYRARLEECCMIGLVMSVAFLPVVLVDENKAPDFNAEDAEMTDFAVEGSALFKERFNGILNNYVEWGLL